MRIQCNSHPETITLALIVLFLLLLSGCGNLKASESVRVVYTPANDGTACYSAYEGSELKGFSCVR